MLNRATINQLKKLRDHLIEIDPQPFLVDKINDALNKREFVQDMHNEEAAMDSFE
jgi:hypothetical protein